MAVVLCLRAGMTIIFFDIEDLFMGQNDQMVPQLAHIIEEKGIY